MSYNKTIQVERIEQTILIIRGKRVMIDRDLASLYGVSTKVLNQAVKRNSDRFPSDFMFVLTKTEKKEVVTNCDHLRNLKFSHNLPFAFTEHGAVMLASVLNSQCAIEASIYVVRAFIKLREILISHKELALKLRELELKVDSHDDQISEIIEVLNQLLTPGKKENKKIGFEVKEKAIRYRG